MADIKSAFVLLARITVKLGMVDEYLEISESADKAVEKIEEGSLGIQVSAYRYKSGPCIGLRPEFV